MGKQVFIEGKMCFTDKESLGVNDIQGMVGIPNDCDPVKIGHGEDGDKRITGNKRVALRCKGATYFYYSKRRR